LKGGLAKFGTLKKPAAAFDLFCPIYLKDARAAALATSASAKLEPLAALLANNLITKS
jgi:hypothetical protein